MKHTELGTLSMAVSGAENPDTAGCGSIFFVTLAQNVSYLDGKHAPFGRVVEEESLETLRKFNEEVLVDENGKPLRDVRIRHVVVLGEWAAAQNLGKSKTSASDSQLSYMYRRSLSGPGWTDSSARIAFADGSPAEIASGG